ncbi:MAG: peptidase S41, partial [Acidobacteriota bacterium]
MPLKNIFAEFFFISTFVFIVFSTTFAQSPNNYLTEPAISPDRKEIAFVSGGDIWTVPSGGGTASLLVSHPANEARPIYSPDGKKLAFTSTRTGNGDVYVLNFATGDLSRITFDDANDQLDAWSRDGNWLYFSSTSKDISGMSDIFRVSANGGTPMQISSDRYTNEFESAPSPDGNSFAFSARGIGGSQWWRKGRSHIDESEIWLKRGDNYEQITQGGAKQLWTMWSADGSRIYFVSDRNGTQNIWTQPIKGQAKQLTNFTDGRVLWANISNDGKQIVFERNFRIWQMNTDNGKASEVPITLRGTAASPLSERINLSTQIREFALSPDGKKVAVIAHGEIYAASAKDGGEAVRITKTAAPESFAAWSTDSKKIAYVSERDGKLLIYQYDFPTETETQITKVGDDTSPVFSPDGKYLAFFRNSRALVVYDLNTKQEREVAKLYIDKSPFIGKRNFVWSPDSRWLGFLTLAPETRSYTNVSVVPVNGGAARPVSFLANSNSNSISWSPDGSFILFDTSQRTEEGSLARIDLKLRVPKFREDQFRDLFKEESPKQKTPPAPVLPNPNTTPTPNVAPSPTISPTPSATPSDSPLSPSSLVDEKKPDENKPTTIDFDDIRRRLSLLETGVDVGNQVISPDGKNVLVLASSEGQFNLYVLPLDELAKDSSA